MWCVFVCFDFSDYKTVVTTEIYTYVKIIKQIHKTKTVYGSDRKTSAELQYINHLNLTTCFRLKMNLFFCLRLFQCSRSFSHRTELSDVFLCHTIPSTLGGGDEQWICFVFGLALFNTYRSVVLTLPVRSENSLISLDRKSSRRRSPCFAAAKISS